MAVSPQHLTLAADVEAVVSFDSNFGQVRIVVVSNPAVIYCNARNSEIPTVAGALSTLAGNEVIPAVLTAFDFRDETTGLTVVRLRSSGTPTVAVSGW